MDPSFSSSSQSHLSQPPKEKLITIPLSRVSYAALSHEDKEKAATAYQQCRLSKNFRKALEDVAINYDLPIAQARLAKEYLNLAALTRNKPDVSLQNDTLSVLWARRSLAHADTVYESLDLEFTSENIYELAFTVYQKSSVNSTIDAVGDYHLLYLLVTRLNEKINHPSQEPGSIQHLKKARQADSHFFEIKHHLNAVVRAGAPSLITYIINLSNHPETFQAKMDYLLFDVELENKMSLYHSLNEKIKQRENVIAQSPLANFPPGLASMIMSYEGSRIMTSYFEMLTALPRASSLKKLSLFTSLETKVAASSSHRKAAPCRPASAL